MRLKFIEQGDGTVLVDMCESRESILCGKFDEEGQFRPFLRFFEGTRARKLSWRELSMLAAKGEELERLYEEKCIAQEEKEEEYDLWKELFDKDE